MFIKITSVLLILFLLVSCYKSQDINEEENFVSYDKSQDINEEENIVSCDKSMGEVFDPTSKSCLCKTKPISFKSHIIDLQKISSIGPPGSITAGREITGRTYLNFIEEVTQGSEVISVYSPADAQLDGIAYYGPNNDLIYAISMKVNCQISFGFAHLGELSPALMFAAPTTPSQSSGGQPLREVKVFAANKHMTFLEPLPVAGF